MGISTFVSGIVKPDDNYKDYYNLYKQCINLGVEVPKEVLKYFNNMDLSEFDENGFDECFISLENLNYHLEQALDFISIKEIGRQNIIEINIEKIPKKYKFIKITQG